MMDEDVLTCVQCQLAERTRIDVTQGMACAASVSHQVVLVTGC
jgi:hypothetical protein